MQEKEIMFRYNEAKAAQLVGKFIVLNGGSINKMKLIKLMYLVDREALSNWGEPITGDNPFSMNFGPVLSKTLDKLNYGDRADSLWEKHIAEANYRVSLKEPLNIDEFNPAELELIEEVFERFRKFDQFQLAEWCHQHCAEWKNPRGSSIPISYCEILSALGKST